jgi:hypothetical protein
MCICIEGRKGRTVIVDKFDGTELCIPLENVYKRN